MRVFFTGDSCIVTDVGCCLTGVLFTGDSCIVTDVRCCLTGTVYRSSFDFYGRYIMSFYGRRLTSYGCYTGTVYRSSFHFYGRYMSFYGRRLTGVTSYGCFKTPVKLFGTTVKQHFISRKNTCHNSCKTTWFQLP